MPWWGVVNLPLPALPGKDTFVLIILQVTIVVSFADDPLCDHHLQEQHFTFIIIDDTIVFRLFTAKNDPLPRGHQVNL